MPQFALILILWVVPFPISWLPELALTFELPLPPGIDFGFSGAPPCYAPPGIPTVQVLPEGWVCELP